MARFSELGVTGLQFAALVSYLERTAAVNLTVGAAVRHPTIALLAEHVSTLADERGGRR
jgi:hypothetical protein